MNYRLLAPLSSLTIILVITQDAGLMGFISLVSGTLIFSVALGGMLFVCSFSTIITLTLDLLNNKLTAERVPVAERVFLTASSLSLISGVVGALVGIVRMFSNWDPIIIGPAMATSLLSLLYGFGLSSLFFTPLAIAARNVLDQKNLHKRTLDNVSHKTWALLVIFTGICGALTSEHLLFNFIDPVGIFVVLSLFVGSVFAAYPTSYIKHMLHIFRSSEPLTSEEGQQSSRFFSELANLILGVGFICTLIGLLLILMSMSTPEHLAPAITVALLTFFYGVMLSELVFRPISKECLSRVPSCSASKVINPNSTLNRMFVIFGLACIPLLCFHMMSQSLELSSSIQFSDWRDGQTPFELLPDTNLQYPVSTASMLQGLEDGEQGCASINNYIICPSEVPADYAYGICTHFGGKLVVLETATENTELGLLLHQLSEKAFWISASSLHQNQTWSWPDGSLIEYNPWEPRVKLDDIDHYPCAATNWNGIGVWTDLSCRTGLGFVCEMSTKPKTKKAPAPSGTNHPQSGVLPKQAPPPSGNLDQ